MLAHGLRVEDRYCVCLVSLCCNGLLVWALPRWNVGSGLVKTRAR